MQSLITLKQSSEYLYHQFKVVEETQIKNFMELIPERYENMIRTLGRQADVMPTPAGLMNFEMSWYHDASPLIDVLYESVYENLYREYESFIPNKENHAYKDMKNVVSDCWDAIENDFIGDIEVAFKLLNLVYHNVIKDELVNNPVVEVW